MTLAGAVVFVDSTAELGDPGVWGVSDPSALQYPARLFPDQRGIGELRLAQSQIHAARGPGHDLADHRDLDTVQASGESGTHGEPAGKGRTRRTSPTVATGYRSRSSSWTDPSVFGSRYLTITGA